MAFLSEPSFQPPNRPCPRWGEQDDIVHGRNYRVCDGFSRFRTNFDACHEVPIEYEVSNLEGFAYPRPFDVNMGNKVTSLAAPTRHIDRGQPIDVFPQHDPNRLNDYGQYCLSESTRDSLQTTTRKLYGNSRYQNMFPGKYIAEEEEPDVETNFKQHCPKHVQFEPYDKMCNCIMSSKEEPHCMEHAECRCLTKSTSYHEGDSNNNFHFIMSSIYNYKLPSALHLPDDQWQEDYFSSINPSKMEQQPMTKKVQTFQRPFLPNNIGALMDSVKTEMDIARYEKTNHQTVSGNLTIETPEPCVGEWENSSVLYKLKLHDKTGTQGRYYKSHEDPLPDLRDNGKYAKRVFFHGYNSSAFRG